MSSIKKTRFEHVIPNGVKRSSVIFCLVNGDVFSGARGEEPAFHGHEVSKMKILPNGRVIIQEASEAFGQSYGYYVEAP